MDRETEKPKGREHEADPRQASFERVREHAQRQLALERTGGRFLESSQTKEARESSKQWEENRVKSPEEVRQEKDIEILRERVPDFRLANWEKLDKVWGRGGRLELLQKAEDWLAVLQNRESMDLIDAKLPTGCGSYNWKTGKCSLSYDDLNHGDWRKALHTYLHEARHAYVLDVILNPQSHPEVAESQRLEWFEAAKTYRGAPGPKASVIEWLAYERHPIEVDAERSAAWTARRIDERHRLIDERMRRES